MSSINFDNVYLLYIAIPLVLLFTIPFALATRKENANGHSIASYVLHIIMAALVAFAAAGTTVTTVLTETNVYVVADVSYSANKNLDTIDNYIKNLKLPKNSKVGIVCFGKDYELLCDLGAQGSVDSVKNSTVDDSETNIAEALEYTGTLFREDVIKRVVLITDGKQTDELDTYAMRRAIDSLEAKDIKVDAIYLDDNISENTQEVQISSAEFNSSAFINHEETVNVVIQSTYDVNATVTLYKDGQYLHRQAPTLTAGTNSVQFELDTSAGGAYDYEVTVSAEGDKSEYNNSYSFTQQVSDDIKVLVVSGSWPTVTSIVEQYAGTDVAIDIYENDVDPYVATLPIKSRFMSQYADDDKINFYCFAENLNPNNAYGVVKKDVPVTIEQLCEYDEILLADINVSKVNNCTEFMLNLDTVVSQFGKSLMTVGNTYIHSSDEAEVEKLDNMLPVRFGKSDSEEKLYTIVFDVSRSMQQLFHLSLAKQVATKLVGILNPTDQICIVSIFGDVRIVQDPITLDNPDRIINIIQNLEPIHGTVIGKGLNQAFNLIRDYPSGDKQVMLITDGLDYAGGEDYVDPVAVAAEMYKSGIVTSVFDVGRQGDSADGTPTTSESATARQLLLNIVAASEGKGKFFMGNNAEYLDDITFGEMTENMTQAVVEETATVSAVRSRDDVLQNIDSNNIPAIDGFYNNALKPGATTVLEAKYLKDEDDETETAVPLYAYWSYGNGKVSCFASTLSDEWLHNWLESEFTGVFFNNVIDVNTPSKKANYPYTLDVIHDGSFTRVQAVPATLHFGASATVEITMPDGEVRNEYLIFDEYFYYYEFKSADVGKYNISVIYSYNNTDYVSTEAFSVSYSSEYDEFASFEASALFRALNGRGTVSTDGNLTLTNDENETGTFKQELTIPLLIIVVSLYVVDIIVRKLKWEDIVSFFGGAKKAGGKK